MEPRGGGEAYGDGDGEGGGEACGSGPNCLREAGRSRERVRHEAGYRCEEGRASNCRKASISEAPHEDHHDICNMTMVNTNNIKVEASMHRNDNLLSAVDT